MNTKFLYWMWIVFILLFLASCSSKVQKLSPKDNLVVFPSPPDEPRIQYLTSFSKSSDIEGKRSGFMASILGEEEEQGITKPYGIAIHNGKIYISDTMLGGLEIIDLKNSTFEFFIPTGLGELKKPINCFVDPEGNLYIADTKRRQIVIFNSDGKYIGSIGKGKEMKPTDVFVLNDKIWITDLQNHRVSVFNKNTYDLIYSFPEPEVTDTLSKLFSPTNLYVTDDEVYVSDFGDFKIKIYSPEGEFIRSVGSYGRGIGQFVRQKGVAVDRDYNLYVVDAGFENVQIFNREGDLLMFFGGSYKKPGDMWLPAKVLIDYDNLEYFQKYVHEDFNLIYLIFITNQYGPDKVSVYGFVEAKN